MILENHLDLKLILEESDPGFLVRQGIKTGTARRFVRDIYEWATDVKTNLSLEDSVEEILSDFAE